MKPKRWIVRPLRGATLALWNRFLAGEEDRMTDFNRQLLAAAQRRAMVMAARGQTVLEPERR
jgi:hypothetical protein